MTIPPCTRHRATAVCRALLLAAAFVPLDATSADAQATRSKASGSVSPPAPDRRRFRADSFLIREWLRGGTKEPERFVEPRQLVVAGEQLIVLDMGTREVSALDAKTGAARFSLAARGEGPGEFKRPALLLARGAEFGVIDQATARLTMFSGRGTYVGDTPMTDAGMLEGGCLLSAGRVLTKVAGTDNALRLVDSTGSVRLQRSLPSSSNAQDHSALMASADVAGPLANGACAIVPRYGAVWYSIVPGGMPVPHPYVEAGVSSLPRAESKTLEKDWRSETRTVTEISNIPPIARGALTIGDTLIVQAGATKRFPFLLLDYYHLPSGRYVYSRRMFASFSALTIGPDGWFYGALIGDENAAVLAFTPATRLPGKGPAGAPVKPTTAVPHQR